MVSSKRPLFLVPLLVGCYSYAPINPAAAPVGTEVRARINGAASDRVAPLLGTFDNRVLVGNVVENTSGAIVLEVPTGAMPNVTSDVVSLHTRVPLVASDLVSLEQRKVDVRRTVLLSGAIAAGAAIGAIAAIHAGGGKSESGGITVEPPPVNRIPIFRLYY